MKIKQITDSEGFTYDNTEINISTTDVRDGIFYGPANIYEGNLEAGASPNEIWSYLLTNISATSSIGKLIKDNLDTTISSRSTDISILDTIQTGTHSIAERIRNVSTVEITGDQLSSI